MDYIKPAPREMNEKEKQQLTQELNKILQEDMKKWDKIIEDVD